MTIKKYLDTHKISRAKFLAKLARAGWKPSEATLCRWINGERKPSAAAMLFLSKVSGGEIS